MFGSSKAMHDEKKQKMCVELNMDNVQPTSYPFWSIGMGKKFQAHHIDDIWHILYNTNINRSLAHTRTLHACMRTYSVSTVYVCIIYTHRNSFDSSTSSIYTFFSSLLLSWLYCCCCCCYYTIRIAAFSFHSSVSNVCFIFFI